LYFDHFIICWTRSRTLFCHFARSETSMWCSFCV